jgi:hypothetical protein
MVRRSDWGLTGEGAMPATVGHSEMKTTVTNAAAFSKDNLRVSPLEKKALV